MGAGQIIENPKAKSLAYAILGGAKDEWMPGDSCYAMVAKAQSLGCVTSLEVEIDRQHQEAPLDRQTAALTWILELQKLQLPSLPKKERDRNIADARARMRNIGAISALLVIASTARIASAEVFQWVARVTVVRRFTRSLGGVAFWCRLAACELRRGLFSWLKWPLEWWSLSRGSWRVTAGVGLFRSNR